ncbi:MAG: acyl carrier protein [Clostridia bacterium]|nr:acyl carrier protein [Clostridia bacterium]
MKEQTRALLAKKLNIAESKIKDETRIVEDLNYDSLDTVEMLMSLEEELDITIPDEQAMKLKTLGDIASYIEKFL